MTSREQDPQIPSDNDRNCRPKVIGWIISMLVTGEGYTDLDYDDPIIEHIEDRLTDYAGVVSATHDGILVTFATSGDTSTVTTNACHLLSDYLETIGASSHSIQAVSLHHEVDAKTALTTGTQPRNILSNN